MTQNLKTVSAHRHYRDSTRVMSILRLQSLHQESITYQLSIVLCYIEVAPVSFVSAGFKRNNANSWRHYGGLQGLLSDACPNIRAKKIIHYWRSCEHEQTTAAPYRSDISSSGVKVGLIGAHQRNNAAGGEVSLGSTHKWSSHQSAGVRESLSICRLDEQKCCNFVPLQQISNSNRHGRVLLFFVIKLSEALISPGGREHWF